MNRSVLIASLLSLFLVVWGSFVTRSNAVAPSRPTLDGLSAYQGAKPVAGATYRFVAMGDWGAGTPFQKDVAAQLAKRYKEAPYQAVLLLGDNIYPDGNVTKHGKAYFTDTYAPLIEQSVQFIVALGNHDVLAGHQDDQLRFFHMPGYYYSVHKPLVDIFVIDSNRFAKDEVQQRWLAKALHASRTPWKVVMGHHPIYSSGDHGLNSGLRKTLEPILVKEKADLYLAGHDHEYERFQPIQGVVHLVSGGGGAYLRNFEKPLPGSLVRVKAHHFLDFEARANQLTLTVISKTGEIIDQALWPKHAPAQLPSAAVVTPKSAALR
ncbi:metallophosphoesterase [Vampirovibrio chlorellavorus]|uniref:metallophosphoesterase n=1 Tax=Vampirovibrio chlorellavorus TaxID=758823 RepID=UPI0026F1A4C4|nr:metallophosphoesterase [Vampirovibrio chlorellavorus]